MYVFLGFGDFHVSCSTALFVPLLGTHVCQLGEVNRVGT